MSIKVRECKTIFYIGSKYVKLEVTTPSTEGKYGSCVYVKDSETDEYEEVLKFTFVVKSEGVSVSESIKFNTGVDNSNKEVVEENKYITLG